MAKRTILHLNGREPQPIEATVTSLAARAVARGFTPEGAAVMAAANRAAERAEMRLQRRVRELSQRGLRTKVGQYDADVLRPEASDGQAQVVVHYPLSENEDDGSGGPIYRELERLAERHNGSVDGSGTDFSSADMSASFDDTEDAVRFARAAKQVKGVISVAAYDTNNDEVDPSGAAYKSARGLRRKSGDDIEALAYEVQQACEVLMESDKIGGPEYKIADKIAQATFDFVAQTRNPDKVGDQVARLEDLKSQFDAAMDVDTFADDDEASNAIHSITAGLGDLIGALQGASGVFDERSANDLRRKRLIKPINIDGPRNVEFWSATNANPETIRADLEEVLKKLGKERHSLQQVLMDGPFSDNPSATEDIEMLESDISDIQDIVILLGENDLEGAFKKANDMDTAVRDRLPSSFWNMETDWRDWNEHMDDRDRPRNNDY